MNFQLYGRIILQMNVHALTGLHIGGAGGKVEIGSVDSPVIRDPLTGRPYLPGSSIRGKMRSLTERLYGKAQKTQIGTTRGKEVYIHTCKAGNTPEIDTQLEKWRADYHKKFADCNVCSIFGVTGDEPAPHPTALIVRDAQLSEESTKRLKEARTDLPYTEVKWEATIDRVTSAATPRQIERVPAGVCFEGLEMVYNIYHSSNLTHFPVLLKAVELLEEDYLGGLGARGSGKVRVELSKVYVRAGEAYELKTYELAAERTISANKANLIKWVNELNFIPAGS